MTFLGPNTNVILTAAAATIAVLGTGGALTEIGPWYLTLRKPSWQPPGWAFAPAWTLIGVLTATAAVLAWEQADSAVGRTTIITLFAINGVCNMAWSLLFFKLRRPDWALSEVVLLWLSVLGLIVGLAAFSRQASALIVPYLLWVSFASVLNRKIVQLNQPFRSIAGLGKARTELGS